MIISHTLAVVVALAAPPSCAALSKTLASAPVGATVIVPAGAPCDLTLRKPVTLRGAPGATLRSIAISGERITVEGLAVEMKPTASTASFASAVRIYQAKDVTLRRLTIRGGLAVSGTPADADSSIRRKDENVVGWPTGRAVTVDRSSNVVLEGLDIAGVHKAIVLAFVDGLTIRGNNVHDLRGSHITGGAVNRVLIENNTFRDLFPWKLGGYGDHADFIHLWTVTQQPHSQDVTIRGNLLDQGKGAATLGIFLEDNGGGGFAGVVIDNNRILNGVGQGMRLERAAGRVTNNILLQASGGAKDAPGIYALDGSQLEIRGNSAADNFGTFKTSPGNTRLKPGVQPAEVLERARMR